MFLPGEPMDRGAWWAIVHGVTKSQTQQHHGCKAVGMKRFFISYFSLFYMTTISLQILYLILKEPSLIFLSILGGYENFFQKDETNVNVG